MARIALNQRLFSSYRLVRSFSTHEVRVLLEPVGLSSAEIERGNALVTKVQTLYRSFGQQVRTLPVVDQLKVWQRLWFPIFEAVLADSSAVVAQAVFGDVRRTNSTKDLYFIELVCGRLLALEQSAEAVDMAAWQLLLAHGTSHDELTRVRDLAVQQARYEVLFAEERATRDAAITELYAFRGKWSRIARAVIRDKRILRLMGIGGAAESPSVDDTTAGPDAPIVVPERVPGVPVTAADKAAPSKSSGSVPRLSVNAPESGVAS